MMLNANNHKRNNSLAESYSALFDKFLKNIIHKIKKCLLSKKNKQTKENSTRSRGWGCTSLQPPFVLNFCVFCTVYVMYVRMRFPSSGDGTDGRLILLLGPWWPYRHVLKRISSREALRAAGNCKRQSHATVRIHTNFSFRTHPRDLRYTCETTDNVNVTYVLCTRSLD